MWARFPIRAKQDNARTEKGGKLKKFLIVLLGLGLAAGLMFLGGCGKKETTIKTPEGEVKVEEEGGEVTIRTEEGETVYRQTTEAPTEEELGAPIYPDAEYVPGSGVTATGAGEGQKISTAAAEFRTEDDFDEVLAWYEGKLGKADIETSEPRAAMWGKYEDTGGVTVRIEEQEGEVVIYIEKYTNE